MTTLTSEQASRSLSKALESIDVNREGGDDLTQIVYMILSLFRLYNLNPEDVDQVGELDLEELVRVSEHVAEHGMKDIRINLNALVSVIDLGHDIGS